MVKTADIAVLSEKGIWMIDYIREFENERECRKKWEKESVKSNE